MAPRCIPVVDISAADHQSRRGRKFRVADDDADVVARAAS